jgi:hypothetical protein
MGNDLAGAVAAIMAADDRGLFAGLSSDQIRGMSERAVAAASQTWPDELARFPHEAGRVKIKHAIAALLKDRR